MKEIKPAMNELQLASMQLKPGFERLATARAGLVSAIRIALIGGGASADYLAKFDKMMSPD